MSRSLSDWADQTTVGVADAVAVATASDQRSGLNSHATPVHRHLSLALDQSEMTDLRRWADVAECGIMGGIAASLAIVIDALGLSDDGKMVVGRLDRAAQGTCIDIAANPGCTHIARAAGVSIVGTDHGTLLGGEASSGSLILIDFSDRLRSQDSADDVGDRTCLDVVSHAEGDDSKIVATAWLHPKLPDCHAPSFGERVRQALAALCGGAVAVGDVSVLLDGEENFGMAATAMPNLEVNTTLTAAFEAQAARTPNAVAVRFLDTSLSYGELDAAAARLSRTLIRKGVGTGTLVAVAMPRSLELVVGLLAVLKAGGAYLPLDPAYPDDWLAMIVADAEPLLAMTTGALCSRMSAFLPEDRIIAVDEASEAAEQQVDGDGPALPRRSCRDLAYVIYTSGSTGTPKGVEITDGNVVRLFKVAQPPIGFGTGDVWTMFHSYAFDFAVWEFWGALLHGGSLVVVPQEISRSPVDFLSLLVREQVTILNLTPSAFYQFVDAEGSDPAQAGRLALRTVILGGEAVDLRRVGDWPARRLRGGPVLVNMYGITETTVHVTHIELGLEHLANPARSPIGIPLADLSVFLLNRFLRPCPINVVGEMFVAGPGVGRGYLNRPEITAQRFLDCPWRSAGDRMYRTGDLAYRGADGALYFVGRSDDQVKVNGFRIEPGEVEAVLMQQDGIREARVIARATRGGDTRLFGYVVAADGFDPRAARLALAETLPAHMVPAAVIQVTRMPLTPNGKLDKGALPDRVADPAPASGPCDEVEMRLLATVRELLPHAHVDVDDDIFNVGGNSMTAMRLVSQVRSQFKVKIAMRKVFDQRTVRQLAEIVRANL